jgi:hypothetical protein
MRLFCHTTRAIGAFLFIVAAILLPRFAFEPGGEHLFVAALLALASTTLAHQSLKEMP